MASDGMSPGKPEFKGFSLTVTAKDEAEAYRLFAALGKDGQVQMPLGKTFFSPRFGAVADRYGAKRVLIAGLFVQALAAGAFVFASRLVDFYATAFVFGLAYGGVMPLYAVLARSYFGPHIMGGVVGAASLIASLGMALGPLAGGWIFDAFGTYTWLYVGSFAVGLGAVAIAFAFPPLQTPKEPAYG